VKTALGVGGILFDVAEETAEAFGPLKAALGAISTIYENYEVRLRPFAQKNRSSSLSDSPSLWFSIKPNTGRSRTAVSSCSCSSCSSAIFSLVSSGSTLLKYISTRNSERSATTSGTFCVAPRYDEPRRHPRISASDYGRRIRDGRAVKRKLKRTECLVCDVIIGEHFEHPKLHHTKSTSTHPSVVSRLPSQSDLTAVAPLAHRWIRAQLTSLLVSSIRTERTPTALPSADILS